MKSCKFWHDSIRVISPRLLLAAFSLLVYGPALRNSFLTTWDDNIYVTGNEAIQLVSWENVVTVFSSYYVGNYAPLHLLSYMADHALWGMNAQGFIVTNLLLHALNGILLFSLVQSMGMSCLGAFVAAIVFLVHPVQVESVVWVSQRKNLLAMTFYLGAVTCYLAYLRGVGRTRTHAYLAAILLFVCAVLTKSVTVILPLALLIYDRFWAQRTPWRQVIIDKLPFALIAFGGVVLTLASQAADVGGGRIDSPTGHPLGMFFTMVTVLVRYLAMLVWPVNLSPYYQVVIRNQFDGAVAGALLVLLVFGYGMYFLYRTERRIFCGVVLFFVGLLPVSQVIPFVSMMNDRYLYFPMLGGAVALSVWVSRCANQLDRIGARIGLVLGGFWLLAMPVFSVQRVFVWENDLTLWSDAVAHDPANVFAWTELGAAYHKAGDYRQAVVQYERALALAPTNRSTLTNIALAQMKLGNYAAAREYLLRQVESNPDYVKGYEDIALTYRLAGQLQDAERIYRLALSREPRLVTSLLALAQVLLHRNNPAEARLMLGRAQELGAPAADITFALACLDAHEGRLAESITKIRSAIRLGKPASAIMTEPLLAAVRRMPEFSQVWY